MRKKNTTAILLAISVIAVDGPWLGTLIVGQAQSAQAKKTAKPPAAQPQPPVIVADIQLARLDDENHLLRIQSSGPLAFDRLKAQNARQVRVKFYRARLGSMPNFDPTSFGSIDVTEDAAGNLLLTIDFRSPTYKTIVLQGGNPNVVEIRVRG